MAKYVYKVGLSPKAIQSVIDKLTFITANSYAFNQVFLKVSLDFIESRAVYYIEQSVGSFSTGELESGFRKYIKDNVGELVNTVFYAALVEYGTGVKGMGTHPLPKDYQYDVNGHGEEGWNYVVDGRVFHTTGMEAHRFMFNALQDYLRVQHKFFDMIIEQHMRGSGI